MKEGFVNKLGGQVKKWKKRFLKLNETDGLLEYYKKDKQTKLGVINLKRAIITEFHHDIYNKANCFGICTNSSTRVYTFQLSTIEEYNQWVSSIENFIEQLNDNLTNDSDSDEFDELRPHVIRLHHDRRKSRISIIAKNNMTYSDSDSDRAALDELSIDSASDNEIIEEEPVPEEVKDQTIEAAVKEEPPTLEEEEEEEEEKADRTEQQQQQKEEEEEEEEEEEDKKKKKKQTKKMKKKKVKKVKKKKKYLLADWLILEKNGKKAKKYYFVLDDYILKWSLTSSSPFINDMHMINTVIYQEDVASNSFYIKQLQGPKNLLHLTVLQANTIDQWINILKTKHYFQATILINFHQLILYHPI